MIAIISLIVAIVLLCGSPLWGASEAQTKLIALGMAVLMGLAALIWTVAIFSYGNRVRQMKQIRLGNGLTGLACVLFGVGYCLSPSFTVLTFSLNVLVPGILALLFAHLAWRRVRADERKVRSADRLR